MSKCIDLIGQKFGNLTVVERAENYISPSKQRKAQWLCKCDCGNLVVVQSQSLIKGLTKSCGCLAKEITSKIKKKYNTYDLSGEYGIGYTTNGEEFYFDLEDYDLIKDYCWHVDKNGYICANYWCNGKNIHKKMHRVVMRVEDSKILIDHISHIKYDNKKTNLRIVTHSQNNMNKGLRSDNTSGVSGVIWYKNKHKWRAIIYVDNQCLPLGYFDRFEDAVKARKEAEEKYYGGYSYDNSQNYNVNIERN